MSHRHAAPAPARPPARRRTGGFLAVTVVAVLVLAVIAGLGIVRATSGDDEPADYPGPGTGSVAVVVSPGDSASVIAATLADADVVRTAGAFVDAANADPRSRGISPGTYRLKQQMSAAGALALMLDPSSRQDVATIPEGTRLDDTLALIAEETRLRLPALEAAADDPASLGLPGYASSASSVEGFLFPSQYDVKPGEDATAFLRGMVDRYRTTTQGIDFAARARALGQDPYDVLIVASIVQDEVAPADYGKAARAIYNRLEQGMRLQLDSTLNYGLDRKTVAVSIADTRIPGPYNTYLNDGLPPTPINSPGKAAIEAALAPVEGDWLYWVTTDLESQTTKFAETYEEFLEYKAEFDASQQ